MSTIAILGSGRVATSLANALSSAGHTVTIGTRTPSTTASGWTGTTITFATPADAVQQASIVINATPGESSVARLSALRAELAGKILIDVSNATQHSDDGMPGGLCYPNSSLAEHLQQALPATKVVKTLNTMLFSVMTNPRSLASAPTAFLSGDDQAAKATVTGLLTELGWPTDWIEDLGDISSARGPEAVILLVPALFRSRGFAPFALTVAG